MVRSTTTLMLVAARDPGSTRLVYTVVILLAVLGVLLAGLAWWLYRTTRPDRELLAPLEALHSRRWRRLDPQGRRRMLDELRPAGAEPVLPARSQPDVDADFRDQPAVRDVRELAESRARPIGAATTRRTTSAEVVGGEPDADVLHMPDRGDMGTPDGSDIAEPEADDIGEPVEELDHDVRPDPLDVPDSTDESDGEPELVVDVESEGAASVELNEPGRAAAARPEAPVAITSRPTQGEPARLFDVADLGPDAERVIEPTPAAPRGPVIVGEVGLFDTVDAAEPADAADATDGTDRPLWTDRDEAWRRWDAELGVADLGHPDPTGNDARNRDAHPGRD
ncbi:MAG: hypothetical protein AAFP84_10775 [Actinomycetota bacterium]